ncbi:protein SPMIP2 [Pseudorasbora parva]|uniref:protein SPMIP2 n=1 Tax=Pseudorasbora parva TaxID=51549 RepID=UPI00351ED462
MMNRVQQDTSSRAETQSASGQRILFTGPDGTGDFRPRLDYFPRSIGIGLSSPDATSDLNYLFRPAAHATPPLPKHRCTGEVGWGLQYSTALNRRTVINNKQNELLSSSAGRSSSQSMAHSAPVSGPPTELLEIHLEPQRT